MLVHDLESMEYNTGLISVCTNRNGTEIHQLIKYYNICEKIKLGINFGNKIVQKIMIAKSECMVCGCEHECVYERERERHGNC